MKAPKKTGAGSDPRCWWCHIETEPETGYRGEAPELGLPRGSGVVICTPACPERPEGARVWAAPLKRRSGTLRKPAKRRHRITTEETP